MQGFTLMIQFLITAYDGTDEEAPVRRAAAKDDHVALGHEMIRTGHVLFSTAILDDEEQTVGSVRVMQFESREQLDEWLTFEPYMTTGVWKSVDIRRCKMGPAFEWITLEAGGTGTSPE